MTATRILITGGTGQVGRALRALRWPDGVTIDAPGRDRLNLEDLDTVKQTIDRGDYAAVVNAGAWTAVDAAEAELGAAFRINALAPAMLAERSRLHKIPLVQVSTDYVFDGTASEPYRHDAPVRPINAYGASKAAGELAVLLGHPRSAVVRTSWVVSANGRNFVRTMLELARGRDEVSVVADQRGAPTAAADLAAALAQITLTMIRRADAPVGVYHFTNSGEASWAEVAEHVFWVSRARGGPWARVRHIPSTDYPTPARRPSYSRLSNTRIRCDHAIVARPWTEAVADVVEGILNGDEE